LTYDAAGQQTVKEDGRQYRTSSTYDAAGRLTEQVLHGDVRTGTSAYDVSFEYDPAGNRLERIDAAAGRTTYAYAAANELLTAKTTAGTTTYTYDATGNRTEKETSTATTTYTWDPSNRLLAANTPTVGRFTFTYNAAGQRVRRETPTEDRKFVYDLKRAKGGRAKGGRESFREKTPEEPARTITGNTLDLELEIPSLSGVSLTVQ